jgi:diacylglycerol kinase (ATP)
MDRGGGDIRKVLIVINTRSGNYKEESFQKALNSVFQKSAYPEIYYFDGKHDIKPIVDKALNEGIRHFGVAGGDGTVSILADALRGRGDIGIIPIGTGNVIARILDLPMAPETALQNLLYSYHIRKIDGLETNGRLYLMSVSAGFTSTLLKDVNTAGKSTFGRLAYVLAAFRSLFSSYENTGVFQIEMDGLKRTIRAAELMVINMAPLGLWRYKIPENRIDDGKLETFVIHRGRFQDILNAFLDLIIRERKITLRILGQAEIININGTSKLSVQADGDIIGGLPVMVKVVPQAAGIIIPHERVNPQK